MSDYRDYDKKALQQLKNDISSAGVMRLVNAAHQGVKAGIDFLEDALENRDFKNCFHQLHNLRSTVATVGLINTANLVQSVEHECKADYTKVKASRVEEVVEVLRMLDAEVFDEIKDFCKPETS